LRANQRYCLDSCAARARWRRWNARNGRAKEHERYRRDKQKRVEKSARIKLQRTLEKTPTDIHEMREMLYKFRGWQKRAALAKGA
jgi:hypothetical protein